MIVKEFYGERNDGVLLYRTYSDIGNYIIQVETGAKYKDAIDVEEKYYTYIESEEAIEREE